MTLACGSVGSEATLVSGGGRRAPPAPPAPPAPRAPSPAAPLDVDLDRMRIAPGVTSRACGTVVNRFLSRVNRSTTYYSRPQNYDYRHKITKPRVWYSILELTNWIPIIINWFLFLLFLGLMAFNGAKRAQMISWKSVKAVDSPSARGRRRRPAGPGARARARWPPSRRPAARPAAGCASGTAPGCGRPRRLHPPQPVPGESESFRYALRLRDDSLLQYVARNRLCSPAVSSPELEVARVV